METKQITEAILGGADIREEIGKAAAQMVESETAQKAECGDGACGDGEEKPEEEVKEEPTEEEPKE